MTPPSPMLAPSEPLDWDELSPTKYYYFQPKLDGIRCKFHRGVPYTRTGKLIPNQQLANSLRDCYLSSPYNGMDLDGELLLWNPVTKWYCPFNTIQSVVMSRKRMNMVEAQDWVYVVFDYHTLVDFVYRINDLRKANGAQPWRNRILLVDTIMCLKHEGQNYVEYLSKLGYEGAMLRLPNSPYKCGRVTRRENYLRKIVEWVRDEAIVLEKRELQHNIDTSCKRVENLHPGDTLGTLLVKSEKFGVFEIGTGFTAAQRAEFWHDPSTVGRRLVYKYRPNHMKDKPCPGVFVGWRAEGEE